MNLDSGPVVINYDWLESVRTDRQPVALFPPVIVGLICIATNPRVFVNPSLLETVINFVGALQATPGFEVRPTTERVLARALALYSSPNDPKARSILDHFRSGTPSKIAFSAGAGSPFTVRGSPLAASGIIRRQKSRLRTPNAETQTLNSELQAGIHRGLREEPGLR
jgi:hypothetical protein